MSKFLIKIKEVYIPYLLIAIGTISIYTLLRWWLDIKLGIVPLKEDILGFWLPFGISLLVMFIWMRRRVRILRVRGKNDNGYFVYQFFMGLTLIAPMIISQEYITTATYDLIQIQQASQASQYAKEKYFEIDTFSLRQDNSLIFITSRTSGKNNDRLHFHVYVACPFEHDPNTWYGVKFKESMSNNASDDEKQKVYSDFIKRAEKEYEAYNFYNATYFEKLGYSDERDGYLEAIKTGFPQMTEEDHVVLSPETEPFEDRLGDKFSWIFKSFGIGAAIIFLMVIIPRIDEFGYGDYKRNDPMIDDDHRFIMSRLNPFGPHKGIAILFLANILVFIVMVLSGLNVVSPTPQELLEIGGVRKYEVLQQGEYWRLLTSVFIHAGLMHLMVNLVGLGFSLIFLDKILGQFFLVVMFVICGIFGSLASIMWHDSIISVGASGAIFGLNGLILAFLLFGVYARESKGAVWIFIVLYGGINLALGFAGGGIDNAAHVGGLVSGFVIGSFLSLADKKTLIRRAENQV